MCQELDVLDIEGASIALDELSARISRRDATGGAGRVDADGKNDAALHMRDGGTLQELRGITSRVGLSLRTSWNVAAESSRSAGTVPPNDTARERQSKATSAHPSSSSGRPSIHPFAPMDASHSLPTSAAEEPAGLLAARAGRVAAERVLRSLSDRDLSAVLAGFAVAMCARDLGIMITLWEASPRSIRDPGAPRQEGAPATKEGPAFGSQAAGVTAASEHMPCSQAAGVTVANDDHMPPEALAPSAPIEHGEVAIDVEDMDRGSMANEEGVPRKFLTIEQRGTRDGFRSQSREEGHRAPASSAAGPGVCTAPAVTVCQGCRRVWLSDGRSLEYKVGIVDADYKPIGRIRQWLLRDREIMQAYLASQSGTRDVA